MTDSPAPRAWTPDEIASHKAEMAMAFGHEPDYFQKMTCDDCPLRDTCELAFDPYNTDGDCLADK